MSHGLLAARDFAVRFQPAGGGRFVPLDGYVAALAELRDGFAASRRALAPSIAERVHRSTSDLRTLLEPSVGPAEPGSLIVPVVFTTATGQLDIEWTKVATLFWRMTANSLWRAARGAAVIGLTAACAESFASAAAGGSKRGYSQVELVDRAGPDKAWSTRLNLTTIERGLRQFVTKKSEPIESIEQIVGRVVALEWDRPSMTLDAQGRRLAVRIPSSLREEAQKMWGREVVVTAKARLSPDGDLRDPVATGIEEATRVADLVDDFDASFGRFKADFEDPEVQAYLRDLRGEPS
ncbi:MAG TPA: hypothetical protein PLI95_01830 [Polyangiaceae bacterium]|nr:hypothetical protein [Polyangiaceae bacterium]